MVIPGLVRPGDSGLYPRGHVTANGGLGGLPKRAHTQPSFVGRISPLSQL